jgi:glutathione S-transferase
MSEVYRIFGGELSPYSVKVRSYFRYKQIPHQWTRRSPDNQAEYQKYAKLPLIPVVATPQDEGLQDSTPILDEMERRVPEPSIHPSDPTAAFISALLEEFGDEWGNKWMFHYRWAREADQISGAKRIVQMMAPDDTVDPPQEMIDGVRGRMVSRVWFVGSNETTAPLIEQSFKEGMALLETHLAGRSYVFGGRPAFADFGLWGQIYNAWTDPTCNEILESGCPNIVAWVDRMLTPKAEGDFEPWSALEPTLVPLLERQVGAIFLPWSDANARAIAAGQEEFSVELSTGTWTQKPQKYHAKSLKALRDRYAAVADKSALDPILERTGCLRWLKGE